jgi:uncharacterized integral membrane protein (TIGR00698 family)
MRTIGLSRRFAVVPQSSLLYLTAVTISVSGIAWIFGSWFTLFGPAVFALLFGAALRTGGLLSSRVSVLAASRLGTRFLQLSIIALGLSVNLHDVLRVTGTALPVMLVTLVVGLVAIMALGHWLRVPGRIRTMLAAGTSICGASAIAAVGGAIGASAMETSYAISVVFVFNVVAVVVFPVVAHNLNLSTSAFGIWAGTAVNDTSSVLAAGYAFGQGAATYAAVVKLSRTMMIVPVTLLAGLLSERFVAREGLRKALRRAIPWFMVGFVAATTANTLGWMPPEAVRAAGVAAQIGSLVALAAIGSATDLRAVRSAGAGPIALGLIGWVIVALTSLAMQSVAGLL